MVTWDEAFNVGYDLKMYDQVNKLGKVSTAQQPWGTRPTTNPKF